MSNRGVQVGGDAEGNIVITGDGNVIISEGWRPASSEPEPAAAPFGPNPYRGLAAFTERDSDRFFGREALTDALWEGLRALQMAPPTEADPQRLLPILGPSGSGKSSLARAGLIAELARRPLPGHDNARVVVLTPGAHPVEALAGVLVRVAAPGATSVLAAMRELETELTRQGEDGAFHGLRRVAETIPNIGVAPLTVLVDQFEENYSLCEDERERKTFIGNLLTAATDPGGRVSVILTLRSDFLGETQNHPRLNQSIARRGFIVPAMSTEELRRAIAGPAEQAGHAIDRRTIEELVAESDGRPGVLPLLQFALTRIWAGMVEGVEPADTLRELGGVGGALAYEAQRLYGSLDEKDRVYARRAFLGLVQLGEGTRDNRRRIRVTDVVAHDSDPDRTREVLRLFARPGARLITLSSDAEGNDTAEVTHEALFEHWALLRHWLDMSRNDLRFHRRLSDAAANWEAQGRPSGALWNPPDLDLLRGLYSRAGDDFTATELAFFRASNAVHQRWKWAKRAAVAALAMLTLFSVGTAFVARQAENRLFARIEGAADVTDAFFDVAARLPQSARVPERTMISIMTFLDSVGDAAPGNSLVAYSLAGAYRRVGYRYLDLLGAPSFEGRTLAPAEKAFTSAARLHETLLAADPKNALYRDGPPWAHLGRGEVLMLSGDDDGAGRDFEVAMQEFGRLDEKQNVNRMRGFRRLGAGLFAAGRTEAAIQSYEKVQIIAGDGGDADRWRHRVDALNSLGAIEIYNGDVERGEALLTSAAESMPETIDPASVLSAQDLLWMLERYAAIALKTGNADLARTLTGTIIDIKTGFAERPNAGFRDFNEIAWTLLTCRPKELQDAAVALRYAKKAALSSDGNDPAILDTLAMAYYRTGQRQEAIVSQRRAVELLAPGDAAYSDYVGRLATYEAEGSDGS